MGGLTRWVGCIWFVALVPGWAGSVVGDDTLGGLTRRIAGRAARASSGEFDPESNRDAYHPRPGQRLVLADLEGPGEVRHLWFTIASRDRRYSRNLVLRVFYDDARWPSVESPIGDFFAAGNGMRANVASLPIEVSSYGRALNCYWRMPFRDRCRIEVHNQGPEVMTVYFQCDWLRREALPEDVRYFHARYRQEYPPRPFTPYTVCELEGEGHYVGTVLSSQNNLASWFGEADDRFYVDGETTPSLVGTGTEDYFNDAWNLRITSHRRVGTTICEPKGDERRVTAYRWHIDDPIPFSKSLKVELERRSFVAATHPETGERRLLDFKYRPDDWSSVAYWYQRGIAEPKWEVPPAEQRLLPEVWIEPTRCVETCRTSPGLTPQVRSNRTCNLKRFFYLRNDQPGGWVEFPVTLATGGRYAVSVFQNCFKHYGIWKVELHGPHGRTLLHPGLDSHDYRLGRAENWPENWEHGTTLEKKVGVHRLAPGDYWLRLECVGANPLSEDPDTGAFGQGYSLGLDAVSFRRLPIEDPWRWIDNYLRAEEALFAERCSETERTVAALGAEVEQLRQTTGSWPRQLPETAPLDPWQQPYRYRAPGLIRPWSYDLYSVHGDSRNPVQWIGNWRAPLQLAREVPPGAVVIEGESLALRGAATGVTATAQQVASEANGPISGGGLLLVNLQQAGGWAEWRLPDRVPPGRYQAYLFAVTSWDYGTCRWTLGATPLGDACDGYSPVVSTASWGGMPIEIGDRPPMLRVACLGKSADAIGCRAGLDALVLIPVDHHP